MCCSYPDWYGAKVTEIRSEDGSFRLRYDDGYYDGFWFAANTEYIRREGNELGSAQRAEGGIRGSGGPPGGPPPGGGAGGARRGSAPLSLLVRSRLRPGSSSQNETT